MMNYILIAVVVFGLSSCVDSNSNLEDLKQEANPTLIINEYAPKGVLVNANNESSDWIELKNNSSKNLIIGEQEWSLTDDINHVDKFYLPKMEIDAGEYILIWCDKAEGIDDNLHANFKLSGNGERIALFRNGIRIDQVIFDQDVKKGVSYGRSLSDNDKWLTFEKPTPGEANLLFDYYAKSME